MRPVRFVHITFLDLTALRELILLPEEFTYSRMSKRVMREKIYTKRRRGRPKVRWLNDVREDLRAMVIEGWRRKAQDRDLWRRIAQ
jgi:hypothetical protein